MTGPSGAEGLLDAHGGRLRRLSEFLLGDREEAREVVQEVFVKACEAIAHARPPEDWAPWLTRVTVNLCRDRRRAGWWVRFRRQTEPVDAVPLAALTPSPADLAVGEETRRQIWAAFRQLPARQREVFALRHIEEWSTEEVAAALSMSPGTVKRHLWRAIRRMRSALGERP